MVVTQLCSNSLATNEVKAMAMARSLSIYHFTLKHLADFKLMGAKNMTP